MNEEHEWLRAWSRGYKDHAVLYVAVGFLFWLQGFGLLFMLNEHIDPATANIAALEVIFDAIGLVGAFFVLYPIAISPLSSFGRWWWRNRGEKA